MFRRHKNMRCLQYRNLWCSTEMHWNIQLVRCSCGWKYFTLPTGILANPESQQALSVPAMWGQPSVSLAKLTWLLHFQASWIAFLLLCCLMIKYVILTNLSCILHSAELISFYSVLVICSVTSQYVAYSLQLIRVAGIYIKLKFAIFPYW